MKSALCLLSGKSCARLIEMFIRQIYRDEEGGGKPTAPGDRGSSSRPGRHCLQGVSRLVQEEEVLEQVCGARYVSAAWKGESRSKADLKGVAGFVGQWVEEALAL